MHKENKNKRNQNINIITIEEKTTKKLYKKLVIVRLQKVQEFKAKENKFSRTYKITKPTHTGPQLKQQSHNTHKHSPTHNHNHTETRIRSSLNKEKCS